MNINLPQCKEILVTYNVSINGGLNENHQKQIYSEMVRQTVEAMLSAVDLSEEKPRVMYLVFADIEEPHISHLRKMV